MTRVSITRLRLRTRWYEIPFIYYALRSSTQAKRADGCLGVHLRRISGAYWTMTLWRDSAALRTFMLSGAHKKAMPKLAKWCDEASLAHWEQQDISMPTWAEGEQRLASEGRVSAVSRPSPAHAAGQTLGTVSI